MNINTHHECCKYYCQFLIPFHYAKRFQLFFLRLWFLFLRLSEPLLTESNTVVANIPITMLHIGKITNILYHQVSDSTIKIMPNSSICYLQKISHKIFRCRCKRGFNLLSSYIQGNSKCPQPFCFLLGNIQSPLVTILYETIHSQIQCISLPQTKASLKH